MRGDRAGAQDLHKSVLAARRLILGEHHPDTSVSAWNLLRTLLERGEKSQVKTVVDELAWLLGCEPGAVGIDQRNIREWLPEIVRRLDLSE
jgi:hypothetical protein